MKKRTFILLIFLASVCSAQIPNEDLLIKIHNINSLNDTNTINNPAIGSLVFVVNNETTYIHNGTNWVTWYKEILYLDSLLQIISNIPTDCCS